MTEPIIPVIRLPVRPESVVDLTSQGGSASFGGVRMRTTIYVVTEADMPGATQNVVVLTAPVGEKIGVEIESWRP